MSDSHCTSTVPPIATIRSHWINTLLVAAFLSAVLLSGGIAIAQETFGPSDPIASIDGEPVLVGELNYLLATKLRVKDVTAVNLDVRQASSALLVRQHLAMNALREQGGQSLQASLDRQWREFLNELQRAGSDLDQHCKQRMSNERSVRQSRDWDVAWRMYLQSKMTDDNLKRYYQLHPEKYARTRWNVSHLFISVDRDSADSEAIAEQRIEGITSRLNSERSSPDSPAKHFAETAMRESEGATAKEGGSIGWVSKPGDLPAVVMDAIRETGPGEMTAPIRSPLGFHLIFVHDKESTEIPFENVTDLTSLRRDAASALFDALVNSQQGKKVAWYIKRLQPPTQ